MTDYLRRVERIEGRLTARMCGDTPCVKCWLSMPMDGVSSLQDYCDGRPLSLSAVLTAMKPEQPPA